MPINLAAGFSASVAVALPVHDQSASTHPTTPSRLSFLPELNPHTPTLSPYSTTCYVFTRPLCPFRLFFSRSVSEGEGELEVYLALLTIDDGRGGGGRGAGRYSKVYARGRGVQRIEGSGGEWYLDGVFGDHASNGLAGTVEQKVVLALHRCQLKPGTQLGVGHLLSRDVEWTGQEAVVTFTFQYLTQLQHVVDLGLAPAPSPAPPSTSPAPPPPLPAAIAIEDHPSPSSTFLRLSNTLLLSILSPAQRLSFLESLLREPEFGPYLSQAVRGELDQAIRALSGTLRSADSSGTDAMPTPVAPAPNVEAVSISPSRSLLAQGSTSSTASRLPLFIPPSSYVRGTSPAGVVPSLSSREREVSERAWSPAHPPPAPPPPQPNHSPSRAASGSGSPSVVASASERVGSPRTGHEGVEQREQ